MEMKESDRLNLDYRHFYVDQNSRRGMCSSDVARNVVTECFRDFDYNKLLKDSIIMLRYTGSSSSVLGFFVEQVLFDKIEKHGIVIHGKKHGRASLIRYNDAAVDGAIFWAENKEDKKTLHAISIRFTITDKDYKDSERTFMGKFDEFVKRNNDPLTYDEINRVFLWLVEEPKTLFRKPMEVNAISRKTRGNEYKAPRYYREVMSVMDANEYVGKLLKIARKNR